MYFRFKISTVFILQATYFLIILLSPLLLLAEESQVGKSSWQPDSFGNHRAVISVSEKSDAAWVRIFWRRKDLNPEKKQIIIIDTTTGEQIKNLCRINISQEFGDLVFQPITVPGDYYIYYLPYSISGPRYFPIISYLEPQNKADPAWLQQHGLTYELLSQVKKDDFTISLVKEIQAIDKFNSFAPMEIIALQAEKNKLLGENFKSPYLLFPENRKFPIRMSDNLPLKWIQSGPRKSFSGEANQGEFYTFQIGIYACRETIENIRIKFNPLKGSHFEIPASAFKCFNMGGINWNGIAFEKTCSVEKGKVLALWFGVQIPENAIPGEYQGKLTILPERGEKTHIKLTLNISNQAIKNSGDDEPWRHSHLRWLDSTIALDNDIVKPFIPLKREASTINLLGRSVSLDELGFPKSIQSRFALAMTHLREQEREILSSPISMVIEQSPNEFFTWRGDGVQFIKQEQGIISWEAQNKAGPVIMDCKASLEFDGYLEFAIDISSSETIDLQDIRLEIPISKDVAIYMQGMGVKSGYRPVEHQWNWNPNKDQYSAWVGDINAGLQFNLLGKRFAGSELPETSLSWYNSGKGGCRFIETGNSSFLICVYSGPMTLKAGKKTRFDFSLLVTPFKTIDLQGQWKTRIMQRYLQPGLISRTTATIINTLWSTRIYPFINYPFFNQEKLSAYINKAHELGLKVNINYQAQEVSNHAPEIFALQNLGDEIFSSGQGGGYSWLQEHLNPGYSAGQYVPVQKDATIRTNEYSRWINYYLEGLNWTIKNLEVDGLHLNDPGFDRTTMKRIWKIFNRNRAGAVIDIFSPNKFNQKDGFINSSNLHLELFPYVNRICLGKDLNQDEPPDFWLIGLSGIPFGVMGDMLKGGENPWRAMLYGMTSRHAPMSGNPREFWRTWDQFGIQEAKMFGYWLPSCPVWSNHDQVLVTSYVKADKVLIVAASWADKPISFKLKYNWDMLGLNENQSQLLIPHLDYVQGYYAFNTPTENIKVPGKKGFVMILRKKSERSKKR